MLRLMRVLQQLDLLELEAEERSHVCVSCSVRGIKRTMDLIKPALGAPGWSCQCGRWEPAQAGGN